MDTLSRRGRIAGAAAIAVFVAACSSQAGGGSTPAASAAPQASAGAGAAVTVNVHQDATLGAYVTGESGRTLYLLTKDSANTSTCSGNCAATWPPLLVGSGGTVTAGTGVSGTLTTFKRDDGTEQVALNGVPLYYYTGDSVAGDTNGQGTNGVWFVASPSGTAVGAPGSSPAASPAGSQGSTKYGY